MSFCPLEVLVLPGLSGHARSCVGQLTQSSHQPPLKPFSVHQAPAACLAQRKHAERGRGKEHVPRRAQHPQLTASLALCLCNVGVNLPVGQDRDTSMP